MKVEVIDIGKEHSRYVGQVYQAHYVRLRDYFLTQLGNVAEADACVQETIRHFFFFMEDRCWEADAKYTSVYLMRIAGAVLCSKKLAGKGTRRKNRFAGDELSSRLNKLGNELIRPLRACLESAQFLLRARGSVRPGLKQVSTLRHVPLASS